MEKAPANVSSKCQVDHVTCSTIHASVRLGLRSSKVYFDVGSNRSEWIACTTRRQVSAAECKPAAQVPPTEASRWTTSTSSLMEPDRPRPWSARVQATRQNVRTCNDAPLQQRVKVKSASRRMTSKGRLAKTKCIEKKESPKVRPLKRPGSQERPCRPSCWSWEEGARRECWGGHHPGR